MCLIFSIGYGPDENRKITMNFGPLNRQGGGEDSTSPSPARTTATRSSAASARANRRVRPSRKGSCTCDDISTTPHAGYRPCPRHQQRRRRRVPIRGIRHRVIRSGDMTFSPSRDCRIPHRYRGQASQPPGRLCARRRVRRLPLPLLPRSTRPRPAPRGVLRGLGWRLHRIWGTAWYRDRYGEERKLRKPSRKRSRPRLTACSVTHPARRL